MMRRLPIILIVGFLWTNSAAADAMSERLETKIRGFFKEGEVSSISPSPIKGLYEVMLGPAVLYVSEDGRYAMRGDMFDLEDRRNLTNQKRALARKQVFNTLMANEFVEFSPTKPKTTLYVYTDIDCAYCRKMHREVPTLNKAGIAIRYLAFPRSGLEGESFKKIAAVWCSANKQRAMTEAKQGKPVKASDCKNPVAEHFNLGQAMGVSGTPAVYSASGKQIGGYVPAAELIQMMQSGEI